LICVDFPLGAVQRSSLSSMSARSLDLTSTEGHTSSDFVLGAFRMFRAISNTPGNGFCKTLARTPKRLHSVSFRQQGRQVLIRNSPVVSVTMPPSPRTVASATLSLIFCFDASSEAAQQTPGILRRTSARAPRVCGRATHMNTPTWRRFLTTSESSWLDSEPPRSEEGSPRSSTLQKAYKAAFSGAARNRDW
jgi:hypothetical protein